MKVLQTSRLISYTLLTCLHLLYILWDHANLLVFQGYVAIFCLIISFPKSNRLFQMVGLILFVVSISLFDFNTQSISEFISFFTYSLLLIALLYMLPILNNVMIAGQYDQLVKDLLDSPSKKLNHYYLKSCAASYMLSVFLFLAAIPLCYKIVESKIKQLDHRLRDKILSQVVLRSFALATAWSPFEIMVAFVVIMINVSYLALLPWLLLFSILGSLYHIVSSYKYRKDEMPTGTDSNEHAIDSRFTSNTLRKISKLFMALALFIALVASIQYIFGVPFFASVIWVIAPYSLLWAWFGGFLSRYIQICKQTWKEHTLSMQNFMVLFIPLGFFNQTLSSSELMIDWFQPLLTVSAYPLILFLMIQLICLVLPYLGIHPLITLGILGTVLQPLVDVVNPISLALVLITSTLAPDTTGPYNTTMTLLNQAMRLNPYRISLWNLKFALFYGGLGTLMAYLLL